MPITEAAYECRVKAVKALAEADESIRLRGSSHFKDDDGRVLKCACAVIGDAIGVSFGDQFNPEDGSGIHTGDPYGKLNQALNFDYQFIYRLNDKFNGQHAPVYTFKEIARILDAIWATNAIGPS